MGSPSGDFDTLQSLLKLKRYEQPPPRYFDSLSGRVRHRLLGPDGWRRQTLFSLFNMEFGIKPMLFFVLGAVCCLVALAGFSYVLVKGSPSSGNHPSAAPSLVGPAILLPAAPAAGTPESGAFVRDGDFSTNLLSSPSPATSPVGGFQFKPTPVSYEKK
jgi:hypothetical protein